MTRRPRILFIDNIAVEAAKRVFYRAVAAAGTYEVHLLVPATWREQGGVIAAEPEPDARVHLHVSRILFGHRQHRVIHRDLPAVLAAVRPDLVYVDSEPENYTSVFVRHAMSSATPDARLALVSCRNMDYRTLGFPYKAAFTHRWCDSLFLRHPADILCVRPATGLPLLQGYARNVVQLPYVIDCTVFAPGRASLLPLGGTAIGYVGRLVPEKGVDILLHAFAELPHDTQLFIAGKGPERSALETLARTKGVHDRVRFLEPLSYAAIPAFLSSLDVLVLPSRPSPTWVEQFGRVLIEAMACGVPVVASESGEIPAVLGDGGLLVPPGDAGALTHVLRMLVDAPGRRREIGTAGRARALACFDAPAVAARFLEAVRPLVPPGPSV